MFGKRRKIAKGIEQRGTLEKKAITIDFPRVSKNLEDFMGSLFDLYILAADKRLFGLLNIIFLNSSAFSCIFYPSFSSFILISLTIFCFCCMGLDFLLCVHFEIVRSILSPAVGDRELFMST